MFYSRCNEYTTLPVYVLCCMKYAGILEYHRKLSAMQVVIPGHH